MKLLCLSPDLPHSSPVKETLNFYSGIYSLKYMTWHFHSQNILKNNLSCLLVLSTTCVVHCWLQRQLGRLHRNERFGRYCPKGKTNKYLSFFLFIITYQLRTSETRRKLLVSMEVWQCRVTSPRSCQPSRKSNCSVSPMAANSKQYLCVASSQGPSGFPLLQNLSPFNFPDSFVFASSL